jgi:hypothetical protein
MNCILGDYADKSLLSFGPMTSYSNENNTNEFGFMNIELVFRGLGNDNNIINQTCIDPVYFIKGITEVTKSILQIN